MLKEQSKVKVHFYNGTNYPEKKVEIITRISGKAFEVKKQNGELGIDGNPEHNIYTCKGDIFTPFRVYAQCVEFEDIDTGKIYHFSTISNKLEEIERT